MLKEEKTKDYLEQEGSFSSMQRQQIIDLNL